MTGKYINNDNGICICMINVNDYFSFDVSCVYNFVTIENPPFMGIMMVIKVQYWQDLRRPDLLGRCRFLGLLTMLHSPLWGFSVDHMCIYYIVFTSRIVMMLCKPGFMCSPGMTNMRFT